MTQHNIKPCINNAKIMQNQSRKKCSENAKTSHQRMPWNAKNNATKMREKPHMCPLNKCKTKHKNIKTNTHTQKQRQKQCNKSAQKMQNKCNQKAKQIRSKTFWSLPLHFFALYLRSIFGVLFLKIFCAFP